MGPGGRLKQRRRQAGQENGSGAESLGSSVSDIKGPESGRGRFLIHDVKSSSSDGRSA
jgi:hypothetical protein